MSKFLNTAKCYLESGIFRGFIRIISQYTLEGYISLLAYTIADVVVELCGEAVFLFSFLISVLFLKDGI